jgi:DNA-binding NarL/FixJ family response regulator
MSNYPDRQPTIDSEFLDPNTGKNYWTTMEQRLAKLNETENQIAALIYTGLEGKKIAAKLSKSADSVNLHVFNIKRRLGVDSMVEIAKIWKKLRIEKSDLSEDPDNISHTLS